VEKCYLIHCHWKKITWTKSSRFDVVSISVSKSSMILSWSTKNNLSPKSKQISASTRLESFIVDSKVTILVQASGGGARENELQRASTYRILTCASSSSCMVRPTPPILSTLALSSSNSSSCCLQPPAIKRQTGYEVIEKYMKITKAYPDVNLHQTNPTVFNHAQLYISCLL